ncbi:hypothetical protein [Halorubrum sp. DTA46]|uniref:hypothetical protein n=1 Tax=Halorubrum sp. DTA46 TaxID=3402162 RepID=UPI003AAF115C
MSERTAEATTTVDEDGIRVEKSFTDDAFPVPAVMYELSSTREDPVRIRIVDRIPESFPMDQIGFHPDYESENWTAYKDHRVEFERVLEPGDVVETVFGIRDDEPDLDGFLGTPVIEHVPVGEEIEDVLGTGDTDAVREVLSGDRATLPGMEEPVSDVDNSATADSGPADGEPSTPAPRTVSAGGTAAVTPRAEGESDEIGETEPDAEALDEADSVDDTDESDDGSEPDADGASQTRPSATADAGLAAALAAEIRADEVDESDLATLRDELEVSVPKSVDVRIARLQSSVADIEAYADALAEFIDGEGTARAILEDLDETVETVESEMSAIDDRLAAAAADREDLREDVSQVDDSVSSVSSDVDSVGERVDGVTDRVDGVETTVSTVETTVDEVSDDVSRIDDRTTEIGHSVEDLGDDVETLYEQVDDTAAGLESTEDRVDDVESRLGRFDEEFDDLWDDLAEVDTRLTDIEDRLGDDLGDVESELDDINAHLEELEAFRKRLNEAFGP